MLQVKVNTTFLSRRCHVLSIDLFNGWDINHLVWKITPSKVRRYWLWALFFVKHRSWLLLLFGGIKSKNASCPRCHIHWHCEKWRSYHHVGSASEERKVWDVKFEIKKTIHVALHSFEFILTSLEMRGPCMDTIFQVWPNTSSRKKYFRKRKNDHLMSSLAFVSSWWNWKQSVTDPLGMTSRSPELESKYIQMPEIHPHWCVLENYCSANTWNLLLSWHLGIQHNL